LLFRRTDQVLERRSELFVSPSLELVALAVSFGAGAEFSLTRTNALGHASSARGVRLAATHIAIASERAERLTVELVNASPLR